MVLGSAPVVFTIHNLAYQGVFEPDWLPRLDLPWSLLSVDGLEFWGRISFIKAGIAGADAITTVSPTYAREIQTPELGFGFEGLLQARTRDLTGVLNGIDTVVWDPSTDRHLAAPYSRDALSGKRMSKASLLAAPRSASISTR